MPTLRCGKMYGNSKELDSQVSIFSREDVPINTHSKNTCPKAKATSESLFSIHEKIQRHLRETKLLSKLEVRKLMLILNRMHCSSPTEHDIMVTAQNILAQIYRRIITGNTADGEVLLKDERGSLLEKYETLCNSISNVTNSDNNKELPFTLNHEMPQNFCQGSANISTAETGNELLKSQPSNIIKLRFDGAYDENDGSISFPSELLTNNDFVITQKNVNSALINQNDTSNTETQKNTSAVETNSAYNENNSYDERIIIDDYTQVNVSSVEYISCEITPEISSSKLPESNNQTEVGLISSNAKVSKSIAFEIIANANNISTICSFTKNTPPPSFDASEKTTSNANTPISSDRMKLDGSNFSMPLTENISLSHQIIDNESPGVEDPNQLTVVDYKNETPEITDTEQNLRLEGEIWEKENVGITEETGYDLSDSNSPEIIFIDTQTINSRGNDILDDVETIDDANHGTFQYAQNQEINPEEYSQLSNSQNKEYQAVMYDSDPLDLSLSSLQRDKSDLPRDKFELLSALDTDVIILDRDAPEDVVIITNAAKELQNHSVVNRTLDQSGNESLVFDLERIDSDIEVIEATPTPKLKKLVHTPLNHQRKKSVTVTDNSETEDIIIDETANTMSESAIFKTYSVKKYGVSSPYPSQAQSSSFLNYKSRAKSPRCILSRRTDSDMTSSLRGSLLPPEAQSKNMLMINGEIPIREDLMESTSIVVEAELFSEKQAKLQEKVMRKRDTYRAKWKDIPLTEKISSKFIQKFHIRVFEDPVSSITNIDYKPNFNDFHFMRLAINEINEDMKSSWEMSKNINDALTKAVGGLQGRSTKDWAPAILKNAVTELDSDSSDEENANDKWLMEYIQKAKYEMHDSKEETFKEIRNIESKRRNTWDNGTLEDYEDRAEELESMFKKLEEFDWFIK